MLLPWWAQSIKFLSQGTKVIIFGASSAKAALALALAELGNEIKRKNFCSV